LKPVVHILATCRKPELLPATLFVFDSIRIGFPTARICIRKNPTNINMVELRRAAHRIEADLYEPHNYKVHHEWIEELVLHSKEPFWICDTDVMFHSRVENWEFEEPIAMAGRLIPEFRCQFMRRITHARLHASLLWLDPLEIKSCIAGIDRISPRGPYSTPIPYFAPLFYSLGAKHFFFDTCAQLYHCIGGQPFTAEQNAAFDHLHGGTYSDLMEERMPGIGDKHRAVFAKPSLLRGAVEHQTQYFNERAVSTT
jgi:hypothetical protein